jgi:hypothetical protein
MVFVLKNIPERGRGICRDGLQAVLLCPVVYVSINRKVREPADNTKKEAGFCAQRISGGSLKMPGPSFLRVNLKPGATQTQRRAEQP